MNFHILNYALVSIAAVIAILIIDSSISEKKGKDPLEVRNPFIMSMLSIIFFMSCLAVAILLLIYIFVQSVSLIKEFTSLDAVIIVAIIGGIVSIVTLLISKIIEYKEKRREYLTSKREEPYARFIDTVFKFMQNAKENKYSENELIEDLTSFQKELLLWGSPEIVSKYIRFLNMGTMNHPDELFNVLEDMLNQMREDLDAEKTKKGNILSVFIKGIPQKKQK